MDVLPFFIGISFLFTYVIGRLLERIHVPWVFGAMVVGLFLAFYNPVPEVTSSEAFRFLAELGTYFLLFMVGFEINLKHMMSHGKKIVATSFAVISIEALLGTVFIHFLTDLSWFISGLLALSFATVGEAVLIPILDKSNLLNTKLGSYIVGIGSADDIFEILVLIVVTTFIGGQFDINTYTTLGALVFLFLLTYLFARFHEVGEKFNFMNSFETLFFISMGLLFVFVGIGGVAEAAPLGALMAGVALRSFLPTERRKAIDHEVRVVSYGIFAPIFFLWIGANIDIDSLLTAPLIVVAFVLLSASAKIVGSLLMTGKELGIKKAIALGTGLSVRFSTGIVIVKILYDNALIDSQVYSLLIASSVILTLIVPIVFASLTRNMDQKETMPVSP